MKVCNSEAMKKIRELEEKKRLIVRAEETRSRVSYREGEEMRKTRYDMVSSSKMTLSCASFVCSWVR